MLIDALLDLSTGVGIELGTTANVFLNCTSSVPTFSRYAQLNNDWLLDATANTFHLYNATPRTHCLKT